MGARKRNLTGDPPVHRRCRARGGGPAGPRWRRTGPSSRRRRRPSCCGASCRGAGRESPVDRVLQGLRARPVVLRRHDQERVGVPMRLAGASRDARRSILAVAGRRRSGGRGRARRTPRSRPRPGRARAAWRARCCTSPARRLPESREDPHRQAALTAAKVAFSATSSGNRNPPPGSGAFKSTPDSVRSTVLSSSTPMRSLPYGSSPRRRRLPELDRLRLFLDRQLARQPRARRRRASIEVDANRSSGWRSTSKKSGERRWASRVSSYVVMLAAGPLPRVDGASAAWIVPVNPRARPLIGQSPRCRTSNSSVDPTGYCQRARPG